MGLVDKSVLDIVVESMLLAQEHLNDNMPQDVIQFLSGLYEKLPMDATAEEATDILRDYMHDWNK